jgi:hypothetical protein
VGGAASEKHRGSSARYRFDEMEERELTSRSSCNARLGALTVFSAGFRAKEEWLCGAAWLPPVVQCRGE